MALVYVKDLWSMISNKNSFASNSTVFEVLSAAEQQIIHGLNAYQPASDESEKKLEKSLNETQLTFIIRFAKYLGVDPVQLWYFVQNYFQHEFRGSCESLEELISTDEHFFFLVKEIHSFYLSEQLFLLQTIKIILSSVEINNHPYEAAFKQFLAGIDMNKLKESLIVQLDSAACRSVDIVEGKLSGISEDYVVAWSTYTLQKQLELSQILLYYCYHNDGTTVMDVWHILEICRESQNGHDELSRQGGSIEQMLRICYVQTLLMMYAIGFGVNEGGITMDESDRVNAARQCLAELNLKPGVPGSFKLVWNLVMANQIPSSNEDTIASLAYLHAMITDSLFMEESKLRDIAYEIVSNIFTILLTSLDATLLLNTPSLWNLGKALLKHPMVAAKFWNSDSHFGLRLLFEECRKVFPLHSHYFMNLCAALAEAGAHSIKTLLHELKNQTTYCENKTDSVMCNIRFGDMEGIGYSIRNRSVLPFEALIIPEHTMCKVGTETDDIVACICWDIKFDVCLVLRNNILVLLSKFELGMHLDDEMLETVTEILACLTFILKNEKSNILKYFPQARSTVDLAYYIVERFVRVAHCPPPKILSSCLDIIALLIPTTTVERLQKFMKSGLIPVIKTVDGLTVFDDGHRGLTLPNEHTISGQYNLLKSYLNFILCVIKHSHVEEMCLFGGVLFVLLEVLPKYQTWNYRCEDDKLEIHVMCLEIIHELLPSLHACKKLTRELLPSPSLTNAQEVFVTHLLNSEISQIVLSLFSTIKTGDDVLQARMKKESNWLTGKGRNLITAVKLSLSIFKRVLMLKTFVMDSEDATLLDSLVNERSENFDGDFVIIICRYISHIFDSDLPIMAVETLETLVSVYPMHLFEHLKGRNYFVTEMFLNKLDSDDVDPNLKVAILEFIIACFKNKLELAVMFMNEYPLSWRSTFLTKDVRYRATGNGGFLKFVVRFLKNACEDPCLIQQTLYAACITMVETLLISAKESALEFFNKLPTFWHDFCLILIVDESDNLEICAHVLDSLTRMLFAMDTELPEQLKIVLSRFFDSHMLVKWSKVATSGLSESIDDVGPEESEFCASWRFFLASAFRNPHLGPILARQSFLAKHAFYAIMRELDEEIDTNVEFLGHLSEMFNLFLSHLEVLRLNEITTEIGHATKKFVTLLCNEYTELPSRVKELLLKIATYLAPLDDEDIRGDTTDIGAYFMAIGDMLGIEYAKLYQNDHINVMDVLTNKCPLFIVTLLRTILSIVQNLDHWVEPLHVSGAVDTMMQILQHALVGHSCPGFMDEAAATEQILRNSTYGAQYM